MRKAHIGQTVQEGDAPVPEIEQQVRGPLEGAAVVDVDPGVAVLMARTAMDEEWHAEFAQEVDPRLQPAGGMHHDAVHPPLRDQRAVAGLLLLGRNDGEDHVIAGRRVDLAGAGDEVGEMRIDVLIGGKRHHMPDRHGTSGRQALGRLIRRIAMLAGGLDHPLPRIRIDFRIAVQCTAYCCRR